MRIFKLKNVFGQEYTLMKKESGFLHSVSGLGYDDDTDYRRIGNIFKLISDKRDQDEIAGSIYFSQPGAQQAYQNFVNFCQHKPLTMIYIPDGQNEDFYRDGTVISVSYAESDRLTVSVKFKCFTPPYKLLTVITEPASGVSDGKRYDYTYDFLYRSAENNTVVINVDTELDSPLQIEFEGPMENPVWTHYVNNIQIASGKLNRSIEAGRKVVIDTHSLPYSIKEYDSGGNLTADLYESSDFGTERFFNLKYGQNRITVSDSGSHDTAIKCVGKLFYASV